MLVRGWSSARCKGIVCRCNSWKSPTPLAVSYDVPDKQSAATGLPTAAALKRCHPRLQKPLPALTSSPAAASTSARCRLFCTQTNSTTSLCSFSYACTVLLRVAWVPMMAAASRQGSVPGSGFRGTAQLRTQRDVYHPQASRDLLVKVSLGIANSYPRYQVLGASDKKPMLPLRPAMWTAKPWGFRSSCRAPAPHWSASSPTLPTRRQGPQPWAYTLTSLQHACLLQALALLCIDRDALLPRLHFYHDLPSERGAAWRVNAPESTVVVMASTAGVHHIHPVNLSMQVLRAAELFLLQPAAWPTCIFAVAT